jgi:hypothetical protein
VLDQAQPDGGFAESHTHLQLPEWPSRSPPSHLGADH